MQASTPRKIAVLLGGISPEREVSLRTGAAVASALRELAYEVTEVQVDAVDFVLPPATELAFIALHGTFGEDGQVQAILAGRGVPFTGGNAEASRIAFDKTATKQKFREHGVPTPEGQLVRNRREVTIPLPVFVKPNAQGSSVGSRAAHTEEELEAALVGAFQYGETALVEQLIVGRELTVGVLGDLVLPIAEIRPRAGFYDYANKYTAGRTNYFCPADLPEALAAAIQQQALVAHRAVGAPVYSRVDFLLEPEGSFYCLEVNTIPGMTATSLLPKAAAALGLSFPELCQRIVELSWAARAMESA